MVVLPEVLVGPAAKFLRQGRLVPELDGIRMLDLLGKIGGGEGLEGSVGLRHEKFIQPDELYRRPVSKVA